MLFMTVDIVLDGQKWRTPIIVRIKYVWRKEKKGDKIETLQIEVDELT